MKERIGNLLKAINRGLYEKETETALSLLAAIAGESIILLGAPGVAKSMVARRLKLAFKNASAFEYLMSRFSTPDEIFGPVSISRLKTNDEYVRSTKGYLPTADVVFLDEIWKADPAIQNTLLTAINEKLFRNGTKETRIPMKLLIAASNELPAQGDGLEALWDRFIIRLECRGIKKEANFDMMLLDDSCDCPEMPSEELQISDEEYSLWQADLNKVAVSKTILECIHSIRHHQGRACGRLGRKTRHIHQRQKMEEDNTSYQDICLPTGQTHGGTGGCHSRLPLPLAGARGKRRCEKHCHKCRLLSVGVTPY